MKKILLIPMLFFVFSCVNKPKKPKNLISKEMMEDLLFDMHIANKTRNVKNIDKEKNINYMSIISDKYKIDSTRFKESHTYYMHNINEYHAIYKKIENRLDTLIKKQELIVKVADSLKKLEKKKKKDSLKILKTKK